MNEDLRFRARVEQIASLRLVEERRAAADKLFNEIMSRGYPYFENEHTAILLYKDKVNHVFAIGDMGSWAEETVFSRIENTDLFYLILNLEEDARLEYLIQTDGDAEPRPDPLNPYIVYNGFGPNSELAMPGYQRIPAFNDYITGQKGDYERVKKLFTPPGILPYEHDIYVYLPQSYKREADGYATLYIQDGRDYIEFALTTVLLDEMIVSQQIDPLIAVFINPPNRHLPEKPNRMTEYGLNDDYVRFMADELVPIIDDRYNTKANAEKRLVLGDSFGGLISAYVPFRRPDVFALGYSQSGYQSFQNDQLIKAYQSAATKDIRLFVDVGTYETVVGAGMLPDEETDFLAANRRFEWVLKEKKYDYIYREYAEGHTWGNWRAHLADALIHFFG
jgi:enterochelin esterase family protein